jgi:hypothetical protein
MGRDRRSVEWLVVGLAFGLAWPLWSWRGKVDQAGLVVDASITLITSDRENLSCALERDVGPYRCGFRAPDRPWPGETSRHDLLAPYVAVEHRTFLVPALFDQPALVARYAAEPPANQPRDRLRRFSVRCKLRLVERLDEVGARWSPDWEWTRQTGVWVAEPLACELE